VAAQAFDAIVVGAGQAGLATSYWLTQHGVTHVVLERARIGEAWRSQRWASFRLNTPSWANGLPGLPFPGDPDAFAGPEALVAHFEDYARTFDLPVRTGVEVRASRRDEGGIVLSTTGGDLSAPHVVFAAGDQNRPAVPPIAEQLPVSMRQLHSLEYIAPDQLPPGGVLLVGGGQTGCQIAEELIEAGRRVLMSTSRVPRVPRRYRGRDIVAWLIDSGFFDARPADLPDPAMLRTRQPQASGVDGGRTVSYGRLATIGVTLLGHLAAIDGDSLRFEDDLQEHLRFADSMSAQITTQVDAYIERAGIAAPPAEVDPREAVGHVPPSAPPNALNLADEGVTSVIWCTGVRGDYAWLTADALDASGHPAHIEGVSPLDGLYFVGLTWLSRRRSAILAGVGDDAEHVANVIRDRLPR
jgi:putative flavoprotein involved in K+ transport